MRIVQVYKDYYPVVGGIENTARLLAREIARLPGYDMTVLTTNRGAATERQVIDGVPVIKAGRQATVASTPISLQLFREIRRLDPDIVHLHFPYPWGELAYLLSGHGKMVISYHSDIVKQKGLLRVYEPFLWKLLERAAVIMPTSPNYINSSPYLRRYADKCQVIPLPIDVERFEKVDLAKVQTLRQQWGAPTVLFVGVFRYYKGLPYLIEAMRNVDANLVLVGTGPLEKELRTLASSREVADKVRFAGAVSDEDLPSYYHAADVYVLPACQRSEALGLSLMEAMAASLPVISTELGTGTSYVNAHGETGLVVPPADPDALSEAINRLLGDEMLRRRYGNAARKRVRERFTKEVYVDRVTNVYRTIHERTLG